MLFKTDLCLLCFSPISPQINWETLIFGPIKLQICQKCQSKLEPIQNPVCHICSRPLAKLELQYKKGDHCLDCLKWEQSKKWKHVLQKNYSLYVYNDFMADAIARFKYRGDYAIAKIFSEKLKRIFQQVEYDMLVPIPLSEERLYERGFNQAESLAKEAGAETFHLLNRIHSEKQSKKSRQERIRLPEVFHLSPSAPPIEGKRILLIDDVYTTGSTLRHAAFILLRAGAKSVQSVTLARG